MNTGMLWFDSSQLTLAAKIAKAAAYYKKKYGRRPEMCLVNPGMIAAGQSLADVDGIAVRAWRPVLPGHLWIGIEESANLSKPKTERERDLD